MTAATLLGLKVGELLPALVEVVTAHRTIGTEQTEHHYGGGVVRVVATPSALVIAVANETAA